MQVCVPAPRRGTSPPPTLGGAALALGRPGGALRRWLVGLGERQLPLGSAAILHGWPRRSRSRRRSLPFAHAGPARLLCVCGGGTWGGRVSWIARSRRREGGHNLIPDFITDLGNRNKSVGSARMDEESLVLLTLLFDEMNQCTQHSSERSGRRTHLTLVLPDSLHTGICNVTRVLTVAYGPSRFIIMKAAC